MVEIIKEAQEIVESLTGFMLSLGTLLAVIKMVKDSLK
jgi:hypothetical protein